MPNSRECNHADHKVAIGSPVDGVVDVVVPQAPDPCRGICFAPSCGDISEIEVRLIDKANKIVKISEMNYLKIKCGESKAIDYSGLTAGEDYTLQITVKAGSDEYFATQKYDSGGAPRRMQPKIRVPSRSACIVDQGMAFLPDGRFVAVLGQEYLLAGEIHDSGELVTDNDRYLWEIVQDSHPVASQPERGQHTKYTFEDEGEYVIFLRYAVDESVYDSITMVTVPVSQAPAAPTGGVTGS